LATAKADSGSFAGKSARIETAVSAVSAGAGGERLCPFRLQQRAATDHL